MKLMTMSMIGLLLLCTSCANLNSIHRKGTLLSEADRKVSYVAVDAKQRVILSAASDKTLRVCAEYMPDIFSVISSSLSGQAGYGLGADTKDISVKVAQALSESGAAIRRSQTVNLLAMSMYRTCERYLSDAIDRDEMIIQAARDERMMVSVLAIEQLTSLAQVQNTIVVNAGSANAVGDGAQIKTLEAAKAQADSKKDAALKASQQYAAVLKDAQPSADGKAKVCEAIVDATKQTLCIEARTASVAAAVTEAREEAYYQGVLAASKTASVSVAVPPAEDADSIQLGAGRLSDAAIVKLADTVLALATLGVAIDDEKATCNIAKRNLLLYTPEQLARIDTCSEVKSSADEPSESIGPLLNAGLFVQIPGAVNQGKLSALASMFTRYFGPQFRTHPVSSPDTVQAPSETEIRYFFEQDRFIARNISIALKTPLGVFPKCTKRPGDNAKPGVLQLWVRPGTVIGDTTADRVSFAQVAGAGCS